MLDPIPLGSHRHRRHVTDFQRPNFIFSSNIPLQVATCVAEQHLFLGGTTSRLVDLALKIGTLEVVIELNALLQRNCQLTPFEMVRRNLVFVAKSKASSHSGTGSNSGIEHPNGFTGVWKSVFSMKLPLEVFVASFQLTLKTLKIDLANPAKFEIQFRNDEFCSLLMLCDATIAADIESYIHLRLLAELRSNTDISLDITNSSTILQELPVNEVSTQIRVVQSDGISTLEDANVIDTTLDSIETSALIQKQLVFDEEDYDPSGDEIKVLYSDDSGKCTANEDEDENTPRNEGHISLEEVDLNGAMKSPEMPELAKETQESSEIAELQAPITIKLKNEKRLPEINDGFVSDIQNLRHNEKQRADQQLRKDASNIQQALQTPSQDIAHSTICGPISELSFEVEEINIDDYTPEPADEGLEPCTPSKSAPVDLNESSPLDFFSPPPAHEDSALSSPRRPGQFVLRQQSTPEFQIRKKLSYAMISSDDNLGLEFAFRDNSETVPSFIKEDKKFKFIKVGKVQKFVHLFEEQKDTSRSSSRPGSPLKKAAQ